MAREEFLSKPLLPPPPYFRGDRARLAGLRCADASAFDALYEAYFSRVYSHFQQRLETVAQVERATEAALIAVFQEIGSAPSAMTRDRWIFLQVRRVLLSREGPTLEPARSKSLKVRPPVGGLPPVRLSDRKGG